ncbi:hypothetical protein SCE1572_25885 [Sorangium cellulosum So0157-2]|uniref:N-acetyltransferase domain-containing protein n=1 Tax=Sorangium cellulosum So0157-2 TaxID=1254432 RepID=S4XZ51_SORCE|nr:hypothetical protein SCE1572_25885 [Sorangium cellulosum So0157-2]
MTEGGARVSSTIAVAAAGPEHLAGLEALFEAAGTPCYCRYYHFEGTNNEWLARCSDGQGENRREFAAALAARTDEARGVVALAQGATDVIGWLKVAPAAAVAKAYERRLYRGLPCFAGDRAGVFLIGCAVVHPRHRRQGVATALVAGAVELAPAWGARALEALPRRPREPVSDEELWTGPASAFTRNGFVEVHTFEPYPVLRRTL